MSKSTPFDHASAVAVARAIRTGDITSEAVTRSAIARLKPVHEAFNSVVTFEDDEAITAARSADAAVAAKTPAGPLHGVPLAHKDMFDRTGKIASWGGRIQAGEPAKSDATVISRILGAGALQIAALHLTEFAFGPTGHNYVLGHARNPYDPSRITGGSSSGSAISVATGVIPAAFGSDTAGSLRLPAAACGVKSMKPTWTRVSRAGCMPLSGALDCVGPIARHTEDLAAILQLIAGHDPRDGLTSRQPVPDYMAALSAPVSGLKIAIDERLLADADSSVQERLADAMRPFDEAGCTRTASRIANWGEIDHLTQLVQLPEVASAHGRQIRHRAADYGPQVRARIEFGHFINAADHQTALRARGTILRQFLETAFGDADALILPTFADPVPTIAELDLAGGPTLMAGLARVIYYTRPVNYLGLPAVTLPYARSSGQMANGFQLVGRPFGEATLLSLAAAYERSVPPEVATPLA